MVRVKEAVCVVLCAEVAARIVFSLLLFLLLPVFADAHIEAMFVEFAKRAKDDRLGRDAFPEVLKALFEDPSVDQCAVILNNPYFLDRMYTFLDKEKKGVTHEQLAAGIGTIFSADDNDDAHFYFHCYDPEGKGYMERTGMQKLLRAWLEAQIAVQEKELRQLASKDQTDDETLALFTKAKDKFLSTQADAKIAETVGWAFSAVTTAVPDRITFEEFKVAMARNYDLFDWKGISEDFMDRIDDMSKTGQ